MQFSNVLQENLRQVFVSEITGERKQHYKDFLTDVDNYAQEARKFLDDGYYDSELGNLMPLAMAEALESNIIVFRTDNDQPFFVTPQGVSLHRTIFLVYDPNGPGHYDAALVYQSPHQPCPSKAIKCNCGVNKKELLQSCCKQIHYACRCVCLKAGYPCSDLCRCKGCNNPNGCRLPQVGPKLSRKRRSHELQTEIPSSKRFGTERGEKLTEGVWSSFENIVLRHIVSIGGDNKNTACILKLYNDIVYYSTAPFCVAPLPENTVFRPKVHAQILAKLQYYDKRS